MGISFNKDTHVPADLKGCGSQHSLAPAQKFLQDCGGAATCRITDGNWFFRTRRSGEAALRPVQLPSAQSPGCGSQEGPGQTWARSLALIPLRSMQSPGLGFAPGSSPVWRRSRRPAEQGGDLEQSLEGLNPLNNPRILATRLRSKWVPECCHADMCRRLEKWVDNG